MSACRAHPGGRAVRQAAGRVQPAGAPRIDVVVSLVEGIEAEVERFARRARCLAHHRWRLEDAAVLADSHQRRLAYRRQLPDLVSAIAALGRGQAFAA